MLKKSSSGVLASLASDVKRRSFAGYGIRITRYESSALVGEQRVLARWGGRVKNDGHCEHPALRVESA
ncbi:MAG: hypothetical protein KF682_21080 [Nitrospira sp.]|nr:hypothetical protein [Nitrospira sp.]